MTGVCNFEPVDGSVDGPYGDIVYLIEGPDGALYYLDLGYSDISGQFGISKIRRIRYVTVEPVAGRDRRGQPDLRPDAAVGDLLERRIGRPRGPAAHLRVDVRRRRHLDRRQPDPHLHPAGPVHGAADGLRRRQHDERPRRSRQRGRPADGDDHARRPTAASFVAGDVITFAGDATDPDDGTLPASAFTWNIDFLHEGHVHPGTPVDRRQERDVHDPDEWPRLQRQHPLPHHADGARRRPA